MFKNRSYKLERLDTGDYTPAEYDQFLRDTRFINRFVGDNRALRKTLWREIEREDLREFSVLDVGAGSGELLLTTAKFARRQKRKAILSGLDLNERSARAILEESKEFGEIKAVRGDALNLPFAGKSFDYAICSLMTHHFSDQNVVRILNEMSRVAERKIFIIDLHRHLAAYALYKIFCVVFGISPMVRADGSLSILRSFKPSELKLLAEKTKSKKASVKRYFPFRLVLEITCETG